MLSLLYTLTAAAGLAHQVAQAAPGLDRRACTSWAEAADGETCASLAVTARSSPPSGPSPTQAGLVESCAQFYKVEPKDTCLGIVHKYGTFSLDVFVKWNPTVGQECHGLWLGYYVCVGVPGTPKERQTPSSPSSVQPSPVQPGIDGSCQKFYKADRGDTCLAIVDKHKTFTLEQFMNWNPSVQSDCSALWLGYYYCVAIPGTPTSAPPPAKQGPSPTQPGLDAKCDKYYQALPNDTCQGIVDKFHAFGLDAFYKWNPAVQNDCSGLWAGYHYCVNAP